MSEPTKGIWVDRGNKTDVHIYDGSLEHTPNTIVMGINKPDQKFTSPCVIVDFNDETVRFQSNVNGEPVLVQVDKAVFGERLAVFVKSFIPG